MMTRVLILAMALLGLCAAQVAPAVRWELHGRGLHQQLALHAAGSDSIEGAELAFTFALPKALYLDVFEIPQTWELTLEGPRSNRAKYDPADLFEFRGVECAFPFDLEAAVFKVTEYETNECTVRVGMLKPVIANKIPFKLVVPIHVRYGDPHEDAHNSHMSDSSAHVCLGEELAAVRHSAAGEEVQRWVYNLQLADKVCTEVPLGKFALLPMVYQCTMGLLIFGVALVCWAIQ